MISLLKEKVCPAANVQQQALDTVLAQHHMAETDGGKACESSSYSAILDFLCARDTELGNSGRQEKKE